MSSSASTRSASTSSTSTRSASTWSATARRVVVAAGAAVLATGLLAAPAQAADASIVVKVGVTVVARGTWDDSLDTLCVTVLQNSARDFAHLGLQRLDGSAPPRDAWEVTTEKRQGRLCTPNLSIPEDVQHDMYLQWRDRDANGNVLAIKNAGPVRIWS